MKTREAVAALLKDGGSSGVRESMLAQEMLWVMSQKLMHHKVNVIYSGCCTVSLQIATP